MQMWGIELYYWVILLPIVCGLLGFLINRLRTEFDFLAFVGTLFFAIQIFIKTRTGIESQLIGSIAGIDFAIYLDSLSGLIILFIASFAFLIWLFSLRAMSRKPRERVYYFYLALTLAAANGVVISGNLIFLLIFWNVLVFSLYGLLQVGKDTKDSSFAARKAITIIGVADYVLMLGIVILLIKVGNVNFPVQQKIMFSDPWMIASYILIMTGGLAKLGTMPLHTWIPESARVVPASTLAFVPGSLDKLLGMYFLIRISYFIFDISSFMAIRIVLMIIGVVTIVFMAIAALMQKEAQRLLAFSTVSQAGYMILGLGIGLPVAIIGALFHMLNNVLYKTTLFLSTGAVETRTKTTELDKLGGIGSKMPVTMFAFIVAALSLSGVPPLNGFYSKWMIYQGIVELSSQYPLWFIFLICAMFGSVLTLAYSLKLVHALFLGERPKQFNKVREARFELVTPSLLLAIACIVFGIFAQAVPLNLLILPALPSLALEEVGFWTPSLATLLILVGLVIGFVLFLFGTALKPHRKHVFIGGEILDEEAARMTGDNFYSSVRSLDMLDKTLNFSEGGAFDIFNYLRGMAAGFATMFKDVINQLIVAVFRYIGKLVQSLGTLVSLLHTGELYNYVGWVFLGGIVILLLLVL
jgi:formate hydrogenlyase subunit 3/multisubunit Na+/H+ antiporter MnhD subunit